MRWGLSIAVLCAPAVVMAQTGVQIAGVVSDLTSSQPLPYVNIFSNGKLLSATDKQGFFTLTIAQNDTLVFTRLGYKPYLLAASESNLDKRILMTEMSVMLDEVVIHDSYKIHGHDRIREYIIENATRNTYNNFSLMPQTGMVQTFGPSIGYRIPWDQWTKEGREKKKLESIRSEYARTAVYREFIQSKQVEEYMMDTFHLDYDTYMKRKEEFIVAYPDARHIQNRKDLIDLMVMYLATAK